MLKKIPVDRKYDPVNMITNKKQTWKVVVLLDDIWTVYKGESEDHIEMLLRDIKVNLVILFTNFYSYDISNSHVFVLFDFIGRHYTGYNYA
jgi:hypothetical protein